MQKLALNALPPGMCGRVETLAAQGLQRRRLMDMGMMPGAEVEALHTAPFGDPTAYKVQGVVIALRAGDAQKITVVLRS